MRDKIFMCKYVIVGDTDIYKNCLIKVCGSSHSNAAKQLEDMLNNPTENDVRLMEGHYNFRISQVPIDKCWWLNNCD